MPQTPASTGRVAHDRQHLGRHLHDDRVGVAVGHQPGQRAAAGHPVAAGVVDDDQVDAAGLGELRREAGAGARADDRPAGVDLRAQARERLSPLRSASISSWSRFAIASAKAGSLTSASSSSSSTLVGRRLRAALEKSASSASGRGRLALRGDHRDALQRQEQHRRPGRRVQLPRDDRRPSSAFSAGVVRISVTVGLWS